MSAIKVNECGAYERDVEQNWAAAYAKRLVEKEALERDQAITEAVDLEAAAREEAIAEEEAARVAKDNALADGTALADKCIFSRHIREGNVTSGKIHDLDVTEQKLAKGAVTEEKLANNSVSSGKIKDYAVTNIKLDSDVFATVQETRWGDDTHKAVTPNGLKQAIGSMIPGDVSNGDFALENIPISAIDEDVTSIFGNPVRDAGLREYSTTPQRVGTWVDGTPVWRVALPYIRMEHGVRHLVANSSRGDIYLPLSSFFVDYIDNTYNIDIVQIVNMNIYAFNDNPIALEPPSEISWGMVYFCQNDPESDLFRQGSWGGYIDFVCPEEYIISDEG